MTRAVVVGGGIGGLAAAIALRDAGIDAHVTERARQIDEVGAALSLWPNALAATERLGVRDAIDAVSSREMSGGVRVPSGRWVAHSDADVVRRALGGPSVLIHRADLQRVLLNGGDGVTVQTGTTVTRVEHRGDKVRVEIEGGEPIDADLVIGADGIWSVVRRAVIADGPPAYSGLAAWRAVIPNTVGVTDSWITARAGNQFLASPMFADQLYLAQAVPLPEGEAVSWPAAVPRLREIFAGWHQPIDELLASTPEDAIIVNDVYERPPPRRLVAGRVALLGDAAHPMTPDLGQGGCQAIEDAAVLRDCLLGETSLTVALHNYQQRRLKRVRAVVRTSHRMGRWMATTNAAVGAVRTMGVRVTPERVQMRFLDRYASRASFEAC
jgi:2-polyprenyl-6-methoxyphenol hydroxylase-like FAD-dependent oxidoreductase